MRSLIQTLTNIACARGRRHSSAVNATVISNQSAAAGDETSVRAAPDTTLGETLEGGAPRRRGPIINKTGRGAVPNSSPHSRRFLTAFALATCLGLALLGGIVVFGRPPIERAEAVSVSVLDAEDRLLRAFTTPDGDRKSVV